MKEPKTIKFTYISKYFKAPKDLSYPDPFIEKTGPVHFFNYVEYFHGIQQIANPELSC